MEPEGFRTPWSLKALGKSREKIVIALVHTLPKILHFEHQTKNMPSFHGIPWEWTRGRVEARTQLHVTGNLKVKKKKGKAAGA